LQLQRQKEEIEARKSDDRKLQKPRRKKESYDGKLDGRRKRAKDAADNQSPPKKRLREGSMNENYGFANQVIPPDFERKRGRPRIHATPAVIINYSRKELRDPIIKKREDGTTPKIRFSDSFESEYYMNLSNANEICVNRATQRSKPLISELIGKTAPFYSSKLPEKQKSSLINSEKKFTMLFDDFPPTYFSAQQCNCSSFTSGAKQFGLFSTITISSYSFICEIFGTFSTDEDLDLRQSSHSVYPAETASGLRATLVPPFVFYVPGNAVDGKRLWLDTREYSSIDSRAIRSVCKSCCTNIEPNATLKLVLLRDSNYIKKYDTSLSEIEKTLPPLILDSSEDEVAEFEKIRLCIFSLKNINAGEEIVLAPTDDLLFFPCACAKLESCEVLHAVSVVDNYNRSLFGGMGIC
jgi:hypothetical protein